jgi:hypothetical protein
MKKAIAILQKPTTLFLWHGATKCGKNMLTIKITITPLPIITNLVFYSKLNYEIGTAYNIEIRECFMQKLVMIKAMNQINIAINLLRKIKTIMLFQITLPICLIFILNRINLTKL